ncbi:WD40 repeat domain-containing protein, partial [Staphylococcus aureus]|uniref:WD40 repeat domain-containing protein n=1 Tax=Staphylococcus aureus TaxID=1280 RepID=UPI003EBF9A4E
MDAKCLHTLYGHTNWVRSVAFDKDGRIIISASDDKTIRVWNSSTGASLQTLSGHIDSVQCINFLGDGRIVSGSLDNT